MRTVLLAAATCGALAVGHVLVPAPAADPAKPASGETAPVPNPAPAPAGRLVAHEWGTFTSFSGSDGVPVPFEPNNDDLPQFVYYPIDRESKLGRFARGGLVSMETPVVYFYTDRETRVSVRVDFPKGWITEWYPFAAGVPTSPRDNRTGGESIRWDVQLTPGAAARFPRESTRRGQAENHYYHARETDAVPLQTEVARSDREYENRGLNGGTIVQREKFLFYRGVGAFAPPVTVKANGGNKVTVRNAAGGPATGLVLVTVSEGKFGFRALDDVPAGGELAAELPAPTASRDDLATHLVKNLSAAGLYEKEAKAMVNTWSDAWLCEGGARLLYLVPRAKTDELLPITIDPKPAELVRVLVGRHDFLTPEQELHAEKQVRRLRAAEAENRAAHGELLKLGRFGHQARVLAEKRVEK